MKLRALPDPVKNYSSVETPAKDLTMSSITSFSQTDFCLLDFGEREGSGLIFTKSVSYPDLFPQLYTWFLGDMPRACERWPVLVFCWSLWKVKELNDI